MISKRVLLTIVVLVIVSPLFGVIGAELVGYHEPLEVAAEKIGLEESEPVWSGILPDYTVPGLPDTIGYILAGFVGVGVLLIPALLRGRQK
ncbi:MAG TPA: cobalamin biosynthesis protein [Candidatus Korarchaeota archaeon]|nr:cobalamin biosynthesis protein [Candidatus Korarchaeota archaeon]